MRDLRSNWRDHWNFDRQALVGMRASLTRGLVFPENDGGKRLAEALDLIDRWNGKAEGRITTMLGLHAPYPLSARAFAGSDRASGGKRSADSYSPGRNQGKRLCK